MKKLTVLVVHPESGLAQRIANDVRETGHDAVVVPDGERAIDRFIQEPADVIVVEMLLPGRDGGTTIESIRWAPGGAHVPAILLGTRGTPTKRLEEVGHRVGAFATLGGPLNDTVVRSLLAGMSSSAAAATRVARSEELERSVSFESTTAQGNSAGRLPVTAPVDPRAFDDEILTDADDELSGGWSRGDDLNAEREGRDVEHTAKLADGAADATVAGDLTQVPFPRLLHRMAVMRATGALVVASGTDARRTTTGESPKKVVYFRAGVPVYVQSNLVQECLGQVLARGGHISAQVLQESIERMRRGEGRQGAVLIAMGSLSPHQLRDALEDQLRVKIFDLFVWSAGRYSFSSRMRPPAETVTLEMSLGEIVLKGVVHRIPPMRLLGLLSPDLDRYVVPHLRRLRRFRDTPMVPEARALLHKLDGTQLLRSLLGESGGRPGAAAQLLYALHCVEAISFEAAPQPVDPIAVVAGEAARGRNLTVVREELTRLGRLLRDGRHAEALEVADGAGSEARERAAALAARYQPFTEPGAAPRELRTLALEVRARLAYVGRPDTGPALRTVAAPDKASAWEETPTRDEKRKRDEAAIPGTRPLAHSEPSQDLNDEPSTEESPPPGSSPDSVSEWAPADYGDPRGLDERVDRLFQAERHFRKGEQALNRGQVAQAMAALARASELCPEEAEFLAHLGYARYQSAAGDPEVIARAMEELERSCRLAPKLDLTHLLLARVLDHRGDRTGARDAFERALAANPDCGEALEGLRSLAGA